MKPKPKPKAKPTPPAELPNLAAPWHVVAKPWKNGQLVADHQITWQLKHGALVCHSLRGHTARRNLQELADRLNAIQGQPKLSSTCFADIPGETARQRRMAGAR